MNKEFLITFRSVTFAQHAQRLLQRDGILCQLQRTPKILTSRGCGYCLRFRGKDARQVTELLQRDQVSYGKLYEITPDGTPEERML